MVLWEWNIILGISWMVLVGSCCYGYLSVRVFDDYL